MARGDSDAAAKRDKQPIIIKKKIVAAQGHHGGAWKVAYADFVTAMMALFIVLWIVGQSKEVREYVSEYFRDPGAFNSKTNASVISTSVQSLGSDATGLKDSMQDDSTGEESREIKAQRRVLTEVERKLREMLDSTPEFGELRDLVELQLTSEGLRIQLLDELSTSVFDVGSPRLRPEGVSLLQKIGEELKILPNTLVIEGHTDSRAYVGKPDYSNWELSSDRANAARRVLEASGVRSRQFRQVRGFADRMLKNSADPFDVHNRRISIIVLFDTSASEEERLLPDMYQYIPLR